MENSAIILTEAGSKFGYGHLMRCLAIAQSLQKKRIRSVFYIRGDLNVNKKLVPFQWKCIDWLKKTVNIKNKIVILDSYHTSTDFCKKIYSMAKTVLFIDDFNRVPYPGGFVLNSAIGSKGVRYHNNPNITYLLGPKYHPLRREFWGVPKKIIKKRIKKVLITFGGSDPTNETPKVLRMLKKKYSYLEKRVMVGSGFTDVDGIKAEADKKTFLVYYPNARILRQEMIKADICISGGGQTTYELARLGVPTVGICLADNQSINLAGWSDAGFLAYAGWYKDKDLIKNIFDKVNDMQPCYARKKMSLVGRKSIDGNGAERIVNFLYKKLDR